MFFILGTVEQNANFATSTLLLSSYLAVYAYPGIAEAGDVGRPQDVPGNVGWAPLPGSPVMLDRTTGILTPCTPSLCPHSHRERVRTYNSTALLAQNNSNNRSSSTENGTDSLPAYPILPANAMDKAGVVRSSKIEHVNRAPFSAQVIDVSVLNLTCIQ